MVLERGAVDVRGRGLRGVGLGLLIACFALLGPGPEAVQPVGGGAQVEIREGDPPLVALTFDDGPRSTPPGRLLEGLALREAPATFFLVGERIAGNEDLIRRMASQLSPILAKRAGWVSLRYFPSRASCAIMVSALFPKKPRSCRFQSS